MIHNPNCDGSYCTYDTGEIRSLALGRMPWQGYLQVCRACFEHEMAWRRERNAKLAEDARFALPDWETLRIVWPAI